MANPPGTNSAELFTAALVGGIFSAQPPILLAGQSCALQLDVNGNLKVVVTGGGSGSNVNIVGINGTPPGPSNPLSVELSDGTNPLGVAGNPAHVTEKNPQTPGSPTQTSVGVASTSVLGANAGRTGLVLVNLSANLISIGLGVAAVLDNGITLTPNGVWVMDAFTFTTGAINAIAGAASSTLAVQEFS